MSAHPTAIVSNDAQIGKGVVIGPFCIIGKDVIIGDGCELASHVVIKGSTKLGKYNKIWQFCTLGDECQHLTSTSNNAKLILGDNNIIREGSTIHRGTIENGAKTLIGNNNFIMGNIHVAHDCRLGDGNIIANGSSLAGHVKLGNYVTLGGHAAIHQHCNIGDYAFIGGCTMVSRDTPPYTKSSGNKQALYGINTFALKKHEFSTESQRAIKRAYRIFYIRNKTPADGLADNDLIELAKEHSEVLYFLEFIKSSLAGIRGLVR